MSEAAKRCLYSYVSTHLNTYLPTHVAKFPSRSRLLF